MTVLIVDDQIDVVQGIRAGVNWESIGVSRVFQAFNAQMAKGILAEDKPRIMLCDIEMPMGSGLELYEWVVREQLDVVCIFLTSHAEFSYAKKALQLGSFDYILQPAEYKDIEKSILGAKAKIEQRELEQEYYQNGVYWKRQEQAVLQSFLSDYYSGLRTKVDQLTQLDINRETPCRCVLLHEQPGQPEKSRMEPDLLNYALNNIVTELFVPFTESLLFFPMRLGYYGILFYGGMPEEIQLDDVLHRLTVLLHEHFGIDISCYVGGETSFGHSQKQMEELYACDYNNVSRSFGVVGNPAPHNSVYTAPDLEEWEELLLNGCTEVVQDKVHAYLSETEGEGRMDAEFLLRFQQDFTQLFFDVIGRYQVKAHEVFAEEYNQQALVKSYTSLDGMRSLVDFMIRFIASKAGNREAIHPQIETVTRYIRENAHRNISRNEMAEKVFLNPQYLSRLFRKQTGYSLSEWILKEKMRKAKTLLKNTGLPVSLIASKVGYTNFSHFAQGYKKVYGISPSEDRKGDGQGEEDVTISTG